MLYANTTNDYQSHMIRDLQKQQAEYAQEYCETKQTVVGRLQGTLYQAKELSDDICQIAEMLLGPAPNMTSEQKASPTRSPGILFDIDEAGDEARRQMERAFHAIKRIRAAF